MISFQSMTYSGVSSSGSKKGRETCVWTLLLRKILPQPRNTRPSPWHLCRPCFQALKLLVNHHVTYVIDYSLPIYRRSLVDALDNQAHPRLLHDAIFEDDSAREPLHLHPRLYAYPPCSRMLEMKGVDSIRSWRIDGSNSVTLIF